MDSKSAYYTDYSLERGFYRVKKRKPVLFVYTSVPAVNMTGDGHPPREIVPQSIKVETPDSRQGTTPEFAFDASPESLLETVLDTKHEISHEPIYQHFLNSSAKEFPPEYSATSPKTELAFQDAATRAQDYTWIYSVGGGAPGVSVQVPNFEPSHVQTMGFEYTPPSSPCHPNGSNARHSNIGWSYDDAVTASWSNVSFVCPLPYYPMRFVDPEALEHHFNVHFDFVCPRCSLVLYEEPSIVLHALWCTENERRECCEEKV